jgi:hypothetical protein
MKRQKDTGQPIQAGIRQNSGSSSAPQQFFQNMEFKYKAAAGVV